MQWNRKRNAYWAVNDRLQETSDQQTNVLRDEDLTKDRVPIDLVLDEKLMKITSDFECECYSLLIVFMWNERNKGFIFFGGKICFLKVEYAVKLLSKGSEVFLPYKGC